LRIIIGLGHPAHFHLFKNVILYFINKSIPFKIVINDKDILKDLLRSANFKFEVLAKNNSAILKVSKLKKMYYSTKKLLGIVKEFNPTILIGCIPQIGFVGIIKHLPSLFFAEDDFKATYLQGIILYPFITNIIAPTVTNTQIFKNKKISYHGYHELAYLNGKYFIPTRHSIDKILQTDKPFFILRFAKLTAHHDVGKTGLTTKLVQKIINKLEKKGNIYITSEREIEPEF